MEAPRNLIGSIVKNAASQAGGKFLLSLLRFVTALLIVRYVGEVRYGEYSLIITMLVVAEWFTDFGMTDIAVRTIAGDPKREPKLMRTLAAAKTVQVIVGPCLLLATVLLAGYDEHIVRAAAIASIGAVAYGGILMLRVLYRVRMMMERDIAAELLGVVAMIPPMWIACARGASLEVLIAIYVFSRVVFLISALLFAGPRVPMLPHWSRRELSWMLGAAAPLGMAGLLVALYNTLDLLMISKLDGLRATGLFAGAQRFIFPLIFICEGLSAALFPVLASFWQRRPEDFRQTLQHAFNVLMFITIGAACTLQCVPALLLALLGPEMVEAEIPLRLLAVALVVRGATSVLAPLFVITGHQRYTFPLTACGVGAKLALLTWLIPIYGILGAAYAWLIADFFVGLLPILIATRHMTGFRIHLTATARAFLAAAATVGLCYGLGTVNTLLAIPLVALAYPALSIALGAVSMGDAKRLLDALRAGKSGGEPAG